MERSDLRPLARYMTCEELVKICYSDTMECPTFKSHCPFSEDVRCNPDANAWRMALGAKAEPTPERQANGNGDCCNSCIYQIEDEETAALYCYCDKAKLTGDTCPSFRDSACTWEQSPCGSCKNYGCHVMAMPQIVFDGIDIPTGFCLPRMRRGRVMLTALTVVNGERQDQYGSAEDNFQRIASYWSQYTGHDFSAHDVAMMMALLKIARIQTGSGKTDSYTDLCGYAALAADMKEKEHD